MNQKLLKEQIKCGIRIKIHQIKPTQIRGQGTALLQTVVGVRLRAWLILSAVRNQSKCGAGHSIARVGWEDGKEKNI